MLTAQSALRTPAPAQSHRGVALEVRIRPRAEVAEVLLQRDILGPAVLPAELASPLDSPHAGVGAADGSHLAGFYQRIERRQCLLQRRGAIIDMSIVEINVVGSEPAQRVLDGGHDGFAPEPLDIFQPRTDAVGQGPHLGGNHQVVSPAAILKPAAEQFLAYPGAAVLGPEGIVVGRVDEVAAGIDIAVEQAARHVFRRGGAEQHRAQRQR